MQTNEMEFDLSPNILDTPSLMTPNLVSTNISFKPSYNSIQNNYSSEHESLINSNPSTHTATTSSTNSSEPSSSSSSSEVKVAQIEDALKQGFARQPTLSPFATIATVNGGMSKIPYSIPNEEPIVTEVPSTADVRRIFMIEYCFVFFCFISQVVSALESLTNTSVSKYLSKPLVTDNSERELTALMADNARCDSSPTPHAPGLMVSPKKIFLIRSQSVTEPTSPAATNSSSNPNLSHSQKTHGDIVNVHLPTELDDDDDDDSMEESIQNQFNRNTQELSTMGESNESHNQIYSTAMTNGTDGSFALQIRTDSNPMQHNIVKQQQQQQTIVINNKRTFPQTISGKTISFE